MGRGAPNRKDLDYFPKMVNFYEDDKIFDLLDEYGPLGVTIYDCILTIVYANGYFANLSKDKLSKMVIRKIGNKWIKSKKVVVQVIDRCADLGLFDKDLMLRDIITSVGIQKRYYKIAVRLMKRQLYSTEYWLLDKNGEPLLKSPISLISSEENGINSEGNSHSSEESTLKIKENKIKQNTTIEGSRIFSEENLEQAFQRFMEHRARLGKTGGRGCSRIAGAGAEETGGDAPGAGGNIGSICYERMERHLSAQKTGSGKNGEGGREP